MKYRYSLITLLALSSLNAQDVSLDAISVTATKIFKGTKEVSQSISVVDEKTIGDKNILNIQEAIENIPGVNAESSTNSPSPRLIIRGAGLKARYGVREVMVMKDGVPLTDPDSFTRFDFIDMQDVASIEVQKGPGSINAANATGGVIQLITKSVFEEDYNRIKLGFGDDGQRNLNLKLRGALGENDFTSVTFSKRKIDNEWRDNNEFDATQFSLKYGHLFEDDSSIETELSYTQSNMNIPTSMTASEFATFESTGEQHDTSAQFQNSSRDSKILALNVRYEKEVGDTTYKPRFYFNTWDHFHPVTGIINESDNNSVYGTDLEFDYNHNLFGDKASLVAGVTLKADITKDSRKYKYAHYVTLPASGWPFTPYISETLSDVKGDLAQTEDSTTTLYGAYIMETFSPLNGLTCDFSTRVDKLSFDISGNEITAYDYSSKNYITGVGLYTTDKSYTLLSSRVGATYKLTETTNMYVSIATANQAPTTSELGENESLEKSTSLNYEVGIKTRAKNISYDLAVYQNDVDDEIIQILDSNGNSIYDNAGKTQKRGLEFNGVYKLSQNMNIGGSYAFSDFKFKKFNEKVGAGLVSRDSNYLPYIPKNQYSLFAAFNMSNGFKTRVTAKSWGSYYMDNANTKKYEGFKFVTNLMVGYGYKSHNIQLNIKNMTNKYYAMEALKNVYGNESYKAGAPMSSMLTYSYLF
ncbi:TonB-dependent receptor [Candidatus Sulfurimonas baltica]|uniref:TonB-dependent receptor n=1 Tax=Candidatus Sulfurimonas baltica TaxID=2740404 RepID=A0A7S7LT87_9BACT|nr:TonB-dependent receptor [Candidatus Sulfurimonas baltica]QOY50887.1 TonB-dependent receptor [Candidatus Sulfurimonas baltica]